MKAALVIILIVLFIGGFVYLTGSRNKNKINTGTNNQAATAETNSVSIKNMSFAPSALTIKTGTEVTWINNDSVTHTVTSDSSVFQSGNIASGSSYKHTFSQAGTFLYHCSIHPTMKARIIVQ